MTFGLESASVVNPVIEYLPDYLLEVPGRPVALARKPFVDRIVVVLFGFDPGVGRVLDHRRTTELPRHPCGRLGEFVHRVRRIELVEHTIFPVRRGILHREAERLHGVLERDEPAPLLALPVWRDGESQNRLGDEPVERRSPGLVKIESREKSPLGDLRGTDPIDDPLHHVGRGDPEDLASEHDVPGVEDLAPVVPRARLTREGHEVLAPVELHLEEPLGNVGVGGSVLAHRAHLHEVRPGAAIANGVEQVERARQVLDLGRDGVVDVDHRVGRAPLLGEVDDRVRLLAGKEAMDERVIFEVTAVEPKLFSQHFPDRLLSVRKRGDRCGRPRANLSNPATGHEVGGADDVVSPSEEVERERPTGVPINTRDEDLRGRTTRDGPAPFKTRTDQRRRG